jgi:hypothetical protein
MMTTDSIYNQIDDLNGSDLTLVNENRHDIKDHLNYGHANGNAIINLEGSSTLLNKPVTLTWNNLNARTPTKLGCIERLKRKKNYEIQPEKALINKGKKN